MSTEVQMLDMLDLERRVKEMYREVAEEPFKEFHFETGRALAERLGYPTGELNAVPAEAIDSFAGVGYYFDLARIGPGGDRGRFGQRLRHGQPRCAPGRRKRPRDRDRHDRGATCESPPPRNRPRLQQRGVCRGAHRAASLPDAAADVVISNGVINLAPRQGEGLRRGRPRYPPRWTARHRRHCDEHAAAPQRDLRRLALGGLHGGAMQRDDHREAIEAAGFELADLKENDQYRFVSERAENATKKYGVRSVSLVAVKR